MNNQELIDAEYGWRLIDYLYGEMINCGISPVEIIYGIIFSLCGDSFLDKPSLDKLYFYLIHSRLLTNFMNGFDGDYAN